MKPSPSPLLFILFQLLISSIIIQKCYAYNASRVPAVLIFGDSFSDTGNNNYIPTLLKATYYPYGRDFPSHIPTGRFSNGKLIPDMLASTLGIKDTVPPFLQPGLSDDQLLTGVNFASAGTGYDHLTAATSNVIPMSKQIMYFKSYIERLKIVAGEDKARKIVNGALIIITAGINDFIISYYDLQSRKVHFTLDGYQDYILNKVQNFVEELYNLGCRTMLIAGLPPLGCLPIQLKFKFQHPFTGTRIETENSDSRAFNKKLVKLFSQIEASLQGTRIIYGDLYTPIMEMITRPQKHGFVETTRGCCSAGLTCNSLTPICADASKYVFFDSIHPGETAYRYIADYLLKEIIPKIDL